MYFIYLFQLGIYISRRKKLINCTNLIGIYTTQKKLRVKGNFLIIFVSMSSLYFRGYMTFFHQGNKLVSNQKYFCVFCL